MKNILLLFLVVSSNYYAQIFESGTNHISVGYGFGNGYSALLKAYQGFEGYRYSGIGPIQLAVEHGITENIGLGASLGYSSYGGNWTQYSYDYEYKWKTISAMVRGAYHLNVSNRNLDPYGGVGIGIIKYSYKWSSNEPNFNESNYNVSSGSPFGYQLFFGARYHFSSHVGGYAEIGYGIALINAGLTFKL